MLLATHSRAAIVGIKCRCDPSTNTVLYAGSQRVRTIQFESSISWISADRNCFRKSEWTFHLAESMAAVLGRKMYSQTPTLDSWTTIGMADALVLSQVLHIGLLHGVLFPTDCSFYCPLLWGYSQSRGETHAVQTAGQVTFTSNRPMKT